MVEQRKKRYYAISEVADMAGVKSHILRYWEGEFSKLRPRKNRAGNRSYTEHDIKVVFLIKKLLYEEKYTIEGARKCLKKDHRELDTGQLEIPFEAMRKKSEINEIRCDLYKLIDMVREM